MFLNLIKLALQKCAYNLASVMRVMHTLLLDIRRAMYVLYVIVHFIEISCHAYLLVCPAT